jgi:TRAP-type C4-dicarboxylate transport system permease small subunit
MDIKPYFDRLIAGVKSAIISIILIIIGWTIADQIASHWYPRHGWYWFLTMMAIWIAYVVLVWLLERAWARYRRSSN